MHTIVRWFAIVMCLVIGGNLLNAEAVLPKPRKFKFKKSYTTRAPRKTFGRIKKSYKLKNSTKREPILLENLNWDANEKRNFFLERTGVDLERRVAISTSASSANKRHSIMPSGTLAYASSDAIKSGMDVELAIKRTGFDYDKGYLIGSWRDRVPWKESRETLGYLWRKMEVTPPSLRFGYLTHEVPMETWKSLSKEYEDFIINSKEINSYLISRLGYFASEDYALEFGDRTRINSFIYKMTTDVLKLRNAFIKDPFIMAQQQYWDQMRAAYVPMLKGVLTSLRISRPDHRIYNVHEFILYNPDHSSPYLPGSSTMIAGDQDADWEDEYDEEDYTTAMSAEQKMAQRAAERAHDAAMMKFTDEADELLTHIPENLHIAFINDDLNPRLNFEAWGKKGLLGKGARVETFSEGRTFLNRVRSGSQYDLVITDLLVPEGGIAMMEELRRLDPNVAVIASSKFEPNDGDIIKTESGKEVLTTEDYFHAGLDGYMWYNNNLNNGSYGYIQYLRQMKNYYYYKNLHGWSR